MRGQKTIGSSQSLFFKAISVAPHKTFLQTFWSSEGNCISLDLWFGYQRLSRQSAVPSAVDGGFTSLRQLALSLFSFRRAFVYALGSVGSLSVLRGFH